MNVAVISDIHANAVALDAVLADLPPVDRIVCLGDALQGGPEPARVASRLRDLGCPVVLGNADAWLVSGEAAAEEKVSVPMREVREWTVAELGDALDAITAFVPTLEVALGQGRTLVAFHGSPRSYDEVLLPETPEEEFRSALGELEFAMSGGHTHLQFVRRFDDGFFFNPGSVGLAYDRLADPETFLFDPWAEYAVVGTDGGNARLEFRRSAFDPDDVVRAYRRSGMPHAESAAARWKR